MGRWSGRGREEEEITEARCTIMRGSANAGEVLWCMVEGMV